MKKIMLVILCSLCLLCSISYGNIIHIFDNDRSQWFYLIYDSTPIFVDHGTMLGLTYDNLGSNSYDFRFDIVYGELDFNISMLYFQNVHGDIIDNSLFLDGTFDGSANTINAIGMCGDAYVNVYEYDFDDIVYKKIGSFTVGSPIPEPATVILLFAGALVLSVNKSIKKGIKIVNSDDQYNK